MLLLSFFSWISEGFRTNFWTFWLPLHPARTNLRQGREVGRTVEVGADGGASRGRSGSAVRVAGNDQLHVILAAGAAFARVPRVGFGASTGGGGEVGVVGGRRYGGDGVAAAAGMACGAMV